MQKRDIEIGLFCPVSIDLTPYINRLQGLGNIRLILANQKNLGPIDMLIYPDGCGILPDTPGLKHGNRKFVCSRPINPWFLSFWENRNFETITEDRDIPIIGIGDAAAMLYSELGGNLIINIDGTILLEGHFGTEFEYEEDRDKNITYFSKDKIYGTMNWIGLTKALQNALEDVRTKDLIDSIDNTDGGEEDLPLSEPIYPTFVPPPAGNHNTKK